MKYDLGGTHPMHPGRLEMTMALARDLGVLARPNLRVVAPQPASDEVLALVHDPGYIAAVRGRRCDSPPSRSPLTDWAARTTQFSS